jgi:hypothetical protein
MASTTITFTHQPSEFNNSVLDGYHIVEPLEPNDMNVEFRRSVNGYVYRFTLVGEARRCLEAANILRERGPGNIVNDDVSREVWNNLVENGFIVVEKQKEFSWV